MAKFSPHNPYCVLIKTVSLLNGCNLELIFSDDPKIGQLNCNSCSGDKRIDYWFAGLKLQVQELRKKLKGSFAHVDYKDRYIRAAYMFAYFPYYIEPIYEVTTNHIGQFILLNNQELNVTFIGGGPIPELLGLSKTIAEKRKNIKKINAYVLDAVQHWVSERKLCTEELLRYYWKNKFTIFTQDYDLFNPNKSIPFVIGKCDLIVVQNCINDCPKESLPNIESNIKKIWSLMRRNSIIVLIDLNYMTVNDLITKLESFFSRNSGKVIKPISSIKNQRPNIPFCEHLETKLYEPTVNGLIARRNVNYYSLIVKKE